MSYSPENKKRIKKRTMQAPLHVMSCKMVNFNYPNQELYTGSRALGLI